MKRLLLVLLVMAIILSLGCAKAPIIADISTQDAFALIEENQDLIIIDVRTPEEFAQGYIENAINLDYRSETFRDELDNLDKDKTYLVYCKVGGRSRSALDIMEELGFMEAYNMEGGIDKWQADGLPITEPTTE